MRMLYNYLWKPISATVGIGMIGFCGYLVLNRKDRLPPTSEEEQAMPLEVGKRNSNSSTNSSADGKSKLTRRQPARCSETLREIILKWEAVEHQSTREILHATQKDLALEAVAKLGASDDFLRFLDYLSTKGAGDTRAWVLQSATSGMFSEPGAEAARSWLLTVNDIGIKSALARKAGEEWVGGNFETYLDALAPSGVGCQSSLLVGYCVRLAKADAETAMRIFKELCVPRKIDYSQLPEVVAAAPSGSNFVKLAGFVGHDDKALAKATRAAVLRNWSGVNPAEAARYVISNSMLVHPDQMRVVIAKWAETDSDAATEWLNQTPFGKARDEGMAELSRHWTVADPARAWEYAVSVGDPMHRTKLAKEVYTEWVKVDREAAAAAWKELYPGR